MDISTILVLGGSIVLWIIGLGVTAVVSSTVALNNGKNNDASDAIAGAMILVYLAVSAIGLGLYL